MRLRHDPFTAAGRLTHVACRHPRTVPRVIKHVFTHGLGHRGITGATAGHTLEDFAKPLRVFSPEGPIDKKLQCEVSAGVAAACPDAHPQRLTCGSLRQRRRGVRGACQGAKGDD